MVAIKSNHRNRNTIIMNINNRWSHQNANISSGSHTNSEIIFSMFSNSKSSNNGTHIHALRSLFSACQNKPKVTRNSKSKLCTCSAFGKSGFAYLHNGCINGACTTLTRQIPIQYFSSSCRFIACDMNFSTAHFVSYLSQIVLHFRCIGNDNAFARYRRDSRTDETTNFVLINSSNDVIYLASKFMKSTDFRTNCFCCN